MHTDLHCITRIVCFTHLDMFVMFVPNNNRMDSTLHEEKKEDL